MIDSHLFIRAVHLINSVFSAVAASRIIRPAAVIRQEHNREYSSSTAHPGFNQLVTMGYYLDSSDPLATVDACHFRFGDGEFG